VKPFFFLFITAVKDGVHMLRDGNRLIGEVAG
jgi:hypothetical protein